jgi:agmatine deiminase
VTMCPARLALLAGSLAAALAASAAPPANGPDGAALPRGLTPAEADYVRAHPIVPEVERGGPVTPVGPVFCPPEYAPMDGIILTFQGDSSWQFILRQMAARITNEGNAKVYAVVVSQTHRNSIFTYLQQGGANMSRVEFIIAPSNSIWVRDYGPRYIYEGGVRAIVDHTYNRPRPQDDLVPFAVGAYKGENVYSIPLVHGGGNFHLSGANDPTGAPDAYATLLVTDENPGLTGDQIRQLWHDYQHLDVTITPAYPVSVDSTRHIDMWMEICADRKVVLSDWPSNPGSAQDLVCDARAAAMTSAGYTVFRVPAFSIGGVHYTYCNVVICNNIVLIPSYTQASVATHNAEALAVWQAAMPGYQVFQIPCEPIVSAAGVMHCIAMHVPAYQGGTNPIAYLQTLRGGETLVPGTSREIRWIADDDAKVADNTDLEVSFDGGNTWSPIASGRPANGSFQWTVPDRATARAKVRVTVRDAVGNTGADRSPVAFTIAGSCLADYNGDGVVNSTDVSDLINAWFEDQVDGGTRADWDNSGLSNSTDVSMFINDWFAASPACAG